MEDEDGEDGFLGNTLASDGMQESPIWALVCFSSSPDDWVFVCLLDSLDCSRV